MAAVVYVLAVYIAYLVRRKVRGDVRKIAVSEVIAPLKNILKNALHVSVISDRDTFAANLVERLAACCDIVLNAGIAVFCKHSGYVARVGYVETVCPGIFVHGARLQRLAVVRRGSHDPAVVTDDFKHRRLARPDVAPQP